MSRDRAHMDLEVVRERTFALVVGLDYDDLHRPLAPIMSPLVWDLGHIAAYEDLWAVHRLAGEPLLRPELARLYDAFETPRSARPGMPLPDYDEALDYLERVRRRTQRVMERTGPHELHELVLRHELQHTETMRQALFLGGLPGGDPPKRLPRCSHGDYVHVPAGAFEMGARDDGFAYDNERPRHTVYVDAFNITRTPIANASFLRFVEGGGYERREWWSNEAWAWKQDHDITHPLGWPDPPNGSDHAAHLDPDAPVQHVSWFEADAFARSCGGRLPTEAEWEKAAVHGFLDATGAVWEWTASEFDGYDGFRAHPYPQYSEVFFRHGYRVLRGGSWATPPGVVTATFRNWDHPQRRQIFSGLRVVHPNDPAAG